MNTNNSDLNSCYKGLLSLQQGTSSHIELMCRKEAIQTIFISLCLHFLFYFCRHEVQHYTNQLAKETNKYVKDISNIPTAALVSDQVTYSGLYLFLEIAAFKT
jgi:hypothetical protein